MNRNLKKQIALLMSLLILWLPLNAVSFAALVDTDESHDMPCHQFYEGQRFYEGTRQPEVVDTSYEQCHETGLSDCQCCDFVSTAVLSFIKPQVGLQWSSSAVIMHSLHDSYVSRTTTPPFKPPRLIA